MESFLISGAPGAVSLEFFERTPPDTRKPVERFKVRLIGPELSAVLRVYVDEVDYGFGLNPSPFTRPDGRELEGLAGRA